MLFLPQLQLRLKLSGLPEAKIFLSGIPLGRRLLQKEDPGSNIFRKLLKKRLGTKAVERVLQWKAGVKLQKMYLLSNVLRIWNSALSNLRLLFKLLKLVSFQKHFLIINQVRLL